MRFVKNLAVFEKPDLRYDTAGLWEALKAIGRAEEAFEPFQSRVWLVFRNVARFLVRTINCEGRPNHPYRPNRLRSSLLAVR